MKNYLIICVALFLTSSCDRTDPEVADQKNDSLMTVILERDSALQSFIVSFNEIEANLDSVAAKQKIIGFYTDNLSDELKNNKKLRINAEIAAINDLMEKNRKELEEMNAKLKNSKNKNKLLEATIATLTTQICQKDYELCELNSKLTEMKGEVERLVTVIDSLGEQNYIKSMVIDYQSSDLNTVYYVVDEEKDLVEEKIIERKGGVLGMGKTTTLAQNMDNTLFVRVDRTKTTEIPIDGKDVKLISTHPADSYLLEKDQLEKGRIKMLVITNGAKFWNTSKYLVIAKR